MNTNKAGFRLCVFVLWTKVISLSIGSVKPFPSVKSELQPENGAANCYHWSVFQLAVLRLYG